MIQMISMLTHNLFLDTSDIINVVTHRSHWNKLILGPLYFRMPQFFLFMSVKVCHTCSIRWVNGTRLHLVHKNMEEM